jgi:putative tryptophan/tyrosine transport system substrate-binding protein
MSAEYGQSGKWRQLLKQIAPHITPVAVIRLLAGGDGQSQLAAIQAVATLYGVAIIPVNVRSSAELERGATDIARAANGGLIVTTEGRYRDVIIGLAARQRLPAVYNDRSFVTEGGLMSYAPDVLDLYRRSAGYMDRVLKGEKPADLPVQAPTKYETVINLKTANCYQHGRQGRLAGQRVRRTLVAQRQVRGGLSASLRQRQRGACFDRPLPQLL